MSCGPSASESRRNYFYFILLCRRFILAFGCGREMNVCTEGCAGGVDVSRTVQVGRGDVTVTKNVAVPAAHHRST